MITCPGSNSHNFTKSGLELQLLINAWRHEQIRKGTCPTCLMKNLANTLAAQAAHITTAAGDRQIWNNAILILRKAADEMATNPPAKFIEHKDTTHG